MTEDDFIEIETALSIRLPDAYRGRLSPFPIARLAGKSDTEVWDDAAALIALNQRLRAEYEDWPAWLFVVGQSAGVPSGYAIDTRTADAPVWWLDWMRPAPWSSGPTEGPFAAWFSQWVTDTAPEFPSERSCLLVCAFWLGLAMLAVMAAWAWIARRIAQRR